MTPNEFLPAKIAEVTKLSPATSYKLTAYFERLGILIEVTGAVRGKLYIFKECLGYYK